MARDGKINGGHTRGYPGLNNRLSTVHRSRLAISGQTALIIGDPSTFYVSRCRAIIAFVLVTPRSSIKVEELKIFRDNRINCSATRFAYILYYTRRVSCVTVYISHALS